MRKNISLSLVATGLAACVGLIGFAAQTHAQDTAGLFDCQNQTVLARGAEIYSDNCAACHGTNLEGQANWRTERSAQGRALAPPHDPTGYTWHHPDIQLFQIVKYGTAALVGGGYQSDMAAYDDVLTDADILAVMAFIKSTWPNDITERHNGINASVAAQ